MAENKDAFLPKTRVEAKRLRVYHKAFQAHAAHTGLGSELSFAAWCRVALDAQAERDLAKQAQQQPAK